MDGLEEEVLEKIKRIKLLVLDVDGVLTDGSIVIDDAGLESKAFDVRDGHGIKLLERGGVRTALLTGRTSRVVEHRARDLGLKIVYQGCKDKREGFERLLREHSLEPGETAYVGDDLVDLPALTRAGFSATVADCAPELTSRVDYVTTRPGGAGAVREITELILKARGAWDDVVERYLG